MSEDFTHVTLLVFADDWGRHPSSCQHLITELLGRYDVIWVNTIGMRPPRLDRSTLLRGWEKIRSWTAARDNPSDNAGRLRVLNPRMWPWMRSRFARWLNRRLLRRQLLRALEDVHGTIVAITTVPVVADVMSDLPVDRWVYYCVDDFSQWPGLDQTAVERMERELVEQADEFIAVSATIQQRLDGMGRRSALLTHGVDLDHWSKSLRPGGASMPELDKIERPLVVFWGVVDQRMDVSFLKRLSADLTEGTILLVGPESDAAAEIRQLPRVVVLPPLSYARLPDLAREAAVLVMPYADLPVTRAMQPLKLKEYLATGRPTVVRALPAVLEWSDCLDLADSPEEFSSKVRARIGGCLPHDQIKARERLASEAWSEKARQFESLIVGRPAAAGDVGIPDHNAATCAVSLP